MSDWGLVAFYYDYEREGRRKETEHVEGFISKAYKYPGVTGMILHAYNGVRFFMRDCMDKHYHIGGEYDYEYPNLNTAFDVFFDHKVVDTGYDNVLAAAEKDLSDDDKLLHMLFNCEGMYGWIYVKFTGNLEESYHLKYGYYYGTDDEYKVISFRDAIRIDLMAKDKDYEPGDENNLPDWLEETIKYFEENAELMDEEEFRDMEKPATEWVKKKMKPDDSTRSVNDSKGEMGVVIKFPKC
jgi:hypothetical protein